MPPSMSALDGILQDLRRQSASMSQRGMNFEKAVKYYLENDPTQKNHFQSVYLWQEWCEKHGNPQQDTGIDLVAETADGGVTAIQAKFYEEGKSTISRDDIDSFFTASGKKPFTGRMFIATVDNWGKHAENALSGQTIPCNRIGLQTLRESTIDWNGLLSGKKAVSRKNAVRPYQEQAINKVCAGLQTADRGKLIMACGTGKTFTALKIAEKIAAGNGGHVLFLVPSLSLLSQALKEWSEQCKRPLHNLVVCSDSSVGKREDEDISLHDLALPATTDAKTLAAQLGRKAANDSSRLTVVFSTYHSIATIADAQKKHQAPVFDLVICDEAHRTTGAEKLNDKGEKEKSYFIKVHDKDYIQAEKRLYMTATPRIYSADSQEKAKKHEVAVYSMDDEATYGEELYRLGFGLAVEQDILSDYKVLVLGVSETAAAAAMAKRDGSGALDLQDNAKLIGCLNALAKKITTPDNTPLPPAEQKPMRRAVAFTTTIKKSKDITDAFNAVLNDSFEVSGQELHMRGEVRHIDGTMNALQRGKELQWLREGGRDEEGCRILSNAKCLSEGVDVPALDAVMFLNPRKSQIDVVQAVGRIMRKAEGKLYGYVILPIVLPPDKEPEEALNSDPNAYKVVWQVLQALRAHDERFEAMINQLELNKTKPDKIQFIGIGSGGGNSDDDVVREGVPGYQTATQLNFPEFFQWRDTILARIVKKCGSKDYWENWAADVGEIARRNITRIHAILDESDDDTPRRKFEAFLKKLRKDLNPLVSEDDAIEMLSQHLITRPVFNALFENYAFASHNPVSRSLDRIIRVLDKHGLEKETEDLELFYKSVRRRAAGIDNAEGKQRVMVELYEKFFSTAFKKQSEKLGIVYTPLEVVDFILQSADVALENEFDRKLSDKDVHILDPFTGTGTFMARLLRAENPLIAKKDLLRKYEHELHANEITLLAYYIAAVNIEEVYHDRVRSDYKPFEGIVLTDTFQLSENTSDTLSDEILQENSERAKRQRKKPIQVIIGNPPYSVGQRNTDDDNPNQEYLHLEKRIADTYAKDSLAVNKNSLYDSYILALRWASDRIKDEGIVAYVTNGSFIDGNAAAGIRRHLLQDFSAVYCFNLRGNARTQGEQRRKEKGNVFGGGTRTAIAITLLIKKEHTGNGKLYYCDIGDYLSREEKLAKIKEYQHYGNIKWQIIEPNKEQDWINQRSLEFIKHLPMGDKQNKYKGAEIKSIFNVFSNGVGTSRDAWVYSFSDEVLSKRIQKMISFYNSQLSKPEVNYNQEQISWSRSLLSSWKRNVRGNYRKENIRTAMYRPFNKQYLYFDRTFIHHPAIGRSLFPESDIKNIAIMVPGTGGSNEFSTLMVDITPDLSILSAGQCFPLHYYTEGKGSGLLGDSGGKQENISVAALRQFRAKYDDDKISKEDIFYYVYGVLHSSQYKQRYAADLSKMLPHIPQVKKRTDFIAFAKAGRKLADLHLHYETVPEYPVKEQYSTMIAEHRNYTVKKMTFAGKQGNYDKSIIKYNNDITLTGIPEQTYEYQVNGKSAIEWIMDRYQQTVHKDSCIANNPNDWSEDPQYILSLLKRVIYVSVESVKIIKSLPELDI